MVQAKAIRQKRRDRRQRWMAGLNVALALVLSGALAVVLNLLAARYVWRADLSGRSDYALSTATRELLAGLPTEVEAVVFLSSEHELYRAIRRLLREYAYAAPRLRVEYLDPHRDLARSKELVLRHDLIEENIVVFAAGGRKKVVPVKELADYDYAPLLSGRPKILTAFRGEQLFSAAIQSLLQLKKPVVYFLSGHGERQPADYDQLAGYSRLARNLERNNIEIKTLHLGQTPALPKDGDALVIAGPVRSFSRTEIELLETYLRASGRILLLLDPGQDAGLNALLQTWGIRLADDRVVGLTMTGRELLVTDYGDHPIVSRLAAARITTIFNSPRSVQPLGAAGGPLPQAADKPRLTVLASCSEEGWAEMSPHQDPPQFDAGVDQPGPVAVAMAVEKGATTSMAVEMRPSRLVVLGDSSFVANGALQAGYSADLFLSAMDWLLERSEGIFSAPKTPGRIQILMSRRQFRLVNGLIVIVLPGLVVAAGLWVGWRRR